ncbi:CMP-N-acetylneuraminic acid synthetase [Pedobacter sp. PACM 27299]|uniref:acylneuraminate cytidylyltransferase family protein n=1 Tax=Pedobacter sp. PACM 27299 TaxID=1727164 RepID=UPI000705FA8C|nr:acylneuraminate cytidylyltransferase family protein [Pedobacter sp. PACM 27299]ALL04390.1 CMP-N-acetylneuraminic acid synthetase [Pedobacter sp. PACM 27299]
MKTLYLIPARGGSKGVPKKNIKNLNGKPLINYTIDVARLLAQDNDICVSTDCDEIISFVNDYGLVVPFKRPEYLSDDKSGTYEVLLHAVNYFADRGKYYDNIMLLQPTSPFRTEQHLKDVFSAYTSDLDMVVSVSQSHQNPYFNLFEENLSGFLEKSKDGYFESRQEAPKVYAYNGSMYLINVNSLILRPLHKFEKIKKYVMDDIHSLDIDTPLDWAICETIIREGYIKHENS